ncbi:MAG: hypothetical protein CM1200mP41_22040 [Gammaproteobacteria bacterium]|nr:MAG: hypothetical protein CM1200mP41_22040 [Gammaproteobacteria bacterium]
MNAEPKDAENIEIIHAADICYVGQSHYLDITVDLADPSVLDSIYSDFIRAHEQVFGYSTESPARIVNLRSIHRSRGRETDVPITIDPISGNPLKERRSVIFDTDSSIEIDILDRVCLPVGAVINGPAIIEQADTTTVLHKSWTAMALESGELLLKKE